MRGHAESSPPSRVSGIDERGAGAEKGSGKGRGTPKVGGDVNADASIEWTKKAFLCLPAKQLNCSKTEPQRMFMDYPGNDVFEADDIKYTATF